MENKIKENPNNYGEGVVWLANSVTVACLYPFDKPIKSLYFRSFFVFFTRFHFKVIQKSLYCNSFFVYF